MSNQAVNNSRRRFLTAATSVVGAVGIAGASVPFLASWQPSAKAKAAGAPVDVDFSKIEPGMLIRVMWRGKPVWLISRTAEMLASLDQQDSLVADPDSLEPQQPEFAANQHRALRPEIFIAVGLCTHLGCSPTYLADSFSDHVDGIEAGFFCPCHGSTFDIAGRVFKGVPAPLNLQIPPYYFTSETQVRIGLLAEEEVA